MGMNYACFPLSVRHPWRVMIPEATVSLECIAVIGKRNSPLYVKNFTDKPDLDLHYFLNISLDFIEDRRLVLQTRQSGDQFLGLVFYLENLNVYALYTVTKVKFVAVLRWQGRPPKETTVKLMLQDIYKSYVSLISNPFYAVDSEIAGPQCRRFHQAVEDATLGQ